MRQRRWYTGRRFSIVLLSDSEEFEIEAFFEGLPAQDQNQVDAILVRIADEGPLYNVEKCRELEDGIYELKTSNVRLFWFYGTGGEIYLSHGRMKNELTKKRAYRAEIKRAKAVRSGLKEGR